MPFSPAPFYVAGKADFRLGSAMSPTRASLKEPQNGHANGATTSQETAPRPQRVPSSSHRVQPDSANHVRSRDPSKRPPVANRNHANAQRVFTNTLRRSSEPGIIAQNHGQMLCAARRRKQTRQKRTKNRKEKTKAIQKNDQAKKPIQTRVCITTYEL